MNQILAVVFDFDDTLGDRNKYAYYLYEQFLLDYIPEKVSNMIYRESLLQDMMIFDQHSYCDKDTILKKIESKYNFKFPNTSLSKYFNENIKNYTVLYDDALSTLSYLRRKYKLGIMTNGDSKSQLDKIKKVIDINLFDSVVVSGDYLFEKPDKRLFQVCIGQLKVPADNIMFVGDSFCNDVMGAINAGMNAIWMWPDDGRIQRTSVKRIKKLSELTEIL